VTEELKWHDLTLGNAFLAPDNFLQSGLNIVPGGLDAYQRVGRKIWMTRLQMNIYAQRVLDTTSITDPEAFAMRFIVLYDKQPNNLGGVTRAEVFSETTQLATSWANLDNRDRFVWLYDNMELLDPIKTRDSDIQTFWTRTTPTMTNWTNTSWPEVAAFTTNIIAGASGVANTPPIVAAVPVGVAAVVKNVDTNVFTDNAVVAMGDVNPPNNDANATHNHVYTYVSGKNFTRKMEIDLDLYLDSEFAAAGTVETGRLLFIMCSNNSFAPDTTNQALVRWNSRLRFIDS